MVTDETIKRYQDTRRRHPMLPAKQAYLMATWPDRRDPRYVYVDGLKEYARGLESGYRGIVETDGFSVVVKFLYDYEREPRGTFTDDYQEGAIQNPKWRPDMSASESVYRWWIPESGYTLEQLAKDYQGPGYGMSRSVAREEARRSLLEEMKDDIEGTEYLAVVTATRAGIELADVVVGGYVLDEMNPEEEMEDEAEDLIAEAVDLAKNKLKELCHGDAWLKFPGFPPVKGSGPVITAQEGAK